MVRLIVKNKIDVKTDTKDFLYVKTTSFTSSLNVLRAFGTKPTNVRFSNDIKDVWSLYVVVCRKKVRRGPIETDDYILF